MEVSKSIMLIDDNDADNYLNKLIIESTGLNVKIRSYLKADAALDELLATTSPPHLILLDINMPKVSGWDFLKFYERNKLNEAHKTIVAMLTGSINPDDAVKARQFEFVSTVLIKPLDPNVISNFLVQELNLQQKQ